MDHRQLVRLGFTAREIRRRVQAGRLHPVHHGVYAVGHLSLTDTGRLRGALLAVGEDAVLSHHAAALVWRLTDVLQEPIELICPRQVRRPGLRVRRQHLDDRERTRRDGLSVASPARALLDLAATDPPARVERFVGEAFALRLVTRPALVVMLEAHRGGRGSAVLRSMLDVEDTRSRAERAFLALVKRARLPAPEANPLLGRRRPDFLWRTAALVVEIDGYAGHSSPWAHERDRRKELALRRMGLDLLRFSARQIRSDAPAVLVDVAQALAARTGAGR